MKRIVLTLLVMALGVASASSKSRPQSGSLINPLLKVMSFKELHPFRDKISDYIETKKADGSVTDIAYYFRSLADGIWHGVNERNEFALASLTKVPVMIAYLQKAQGDPSILTRKVKYEIRQPENRNFIPREQPVEGKYYTVDEMIGFMLRFSDNNAMWILVEGIDGDYLMSVFYDLGLLRTGEQIVGDNISLKSIVSVFRVLYNASYLDVAMSEKALRYLANVDFTDGIMAGLPQGIIVAHKFGERNYLSTGEELHECGIVYYKNNPYLIGIMAKGKDFDSLKEVLRTISAMTYEEVDVQYRTPAADRPRRHIDNE